MRELTLERERGQSEIAASLAGVDAKGHEGQLPKANQLDTYWKSYLSGFGGQLVGEFSIPNHRAPDGYGWVVSFWKIGDTRIRLRYSQIIEQEDWHFDYPEKERLEIKLWGDIDLGLEESLRTYFSEKVAA
jgi:hypothetical protein